MNVFSAFVYAPTGHSKGIGVRKRVALGNTTDTMLLKGSSPGDVAGKSERSIYTVMKLLMWRSRC